jgi:hypothetical protein
VDNDWWPQMTMDEDMVTADGLGSDAGSRGTDDEQRRSSSLTSWFL